MLVIDQRDAMDPVPHAVGGERERRRPIPVPRTGHSAHLMPLEKEAEETRCLITELYLIGPGTEREAGLDGGDLQARRICVVCRMDLAIVRRVSGRDEQRRQNQCRCQAADHQPDTMRRHATGKRTPFATPGLGFATLAREHGDMRPTHIIVGAGQAGGWAAISMRQAGFKGRILLIGEEPWRPYERPPLSKTMLTVEPMPDLQHFHPAAKYVEQDIEFLLGVGVVALDPAAHWIRLTDGRELVYDRLLLTTGGRARRLGVPGGEYALTIRTFEDALAVRTRLATARRVVCIGAGVIGLEIAASARARGAEVTVLEALSGAMGRAVSPEGARFMEQLHREAGVDLRFAVAVERIAQEGTGQDGCVVECRDGTELPADLVVAGIGMERNLALAEQAALAIEGGIVVDPMGRTSVAEIFAAGDVAAFHHPLFGRNLRLEAWRHAQNHGIAVGKVMAGETTPYDDIPWFWTDQHGVNLQIAGLPAEAARTIVRVDDAPRTFIAVHLAADDSVIGVSAANAPREIRAGQALIKSGKPVDIARLADATVPLQQLIPR
jgi:3-phenylpropionate/trans-cinnamate dioxygenase ferredoxin reductase subunit